MDIEAQKARAERFNELDLRELLEDAQDDTSLNEKHVERQSAHYSEKLHNKLLREGYGLEAIEQAYRDSKIVKILI